MFPGQHREKANLITPSMFFMGFFAGGQVGGSGRAEGDRHLGFAFLTGNPSLTGSSCVFKNFDWHCFFYCTFLVSGLYAVVRQKNCLCFQFPLGLVPSPQASH